MPRLGPGPGDPFRTRHPVPALFQRRVFQPRRLRAIQPFLHLREQLTRARGRRLWRVLWQRAPPVVRVVEQPWGAGSFRTEINAKGRPRAPGQPFGTYIEPLVTSAMKFTIRFAARRSGSRSGL
jgi:hypothetical protein